MTQEIATLGGGCFWCLEAPFDQLEGVLEVESGYAGGHLANPTYEQVCSKTTGHAEVVRIVFDNTVISYDDLLTIFFTLHDPTTLNQQGNDKGPQYRSAIFYHSEQQKAVAEAKIKELTQQGLWQNKIVTEVTPINNYYVAEDYHQEYFENNPYAGYCMVVVAPKVTKFRKQFMGRLKKKYQA